MVEGKTLIALDVETTGLFADRDRIVEIGAVRFDKTGNTLDTFDRLVNPRCPMPWSALAIHGISDEMLEGKPGAEEVLPEFLRWIGDASYVTLLAHNSSFDAGFLGAEFGRLGSVPEWKLTDTLALARFLRPEARNHQLATMAHLYGLDPTGPHRALADSYRVKGLWCALTQGLAELPRLTTYPLRCGSTSAAIPSGWDVMAQAMTRGQRVRIEYNGGSQGPRPREITPKRFLHQGGVAYVVALCHLSASEKSFRLDRVVRLELVS